MIINVTPTENKNFLYFECALEDSTESVTKKALELYNFMQYMRLILDNIKDIQSNGQLRAPEARGLEELIEDEKVGPDQDKQKYRDGFKPNENGQRLLSDCQTDINKLLVIFPEQRTPVTHKDFQDVMDKVKGSIMIIYPEGLKPHEKMRELIEMQEDYVAGKTNEDGFINVDAGAVFFSQKSLIARGETMKCLNAPNSSTIKLVPSRSQTYVPRSHGDQANAEMMRFLYMKEQSRQKAEMMTGDDVYGRDWTDGNSLKKQMQGISDIRFK